MPTRTTLALALSLGCTLSAPAQTTYTWRYYRPGNTGIQGDFNESLWVAPDGNPWIGGYDPLAEEGGVAKFVQAENRWINISNIDFPALGTANEVGAARISDIVPDAHGNLWLGGWRGLLRMNLAAGPGSLVMFGPQNSLIPGGRTVDATLAPDGSIWASATSTAWGPGGLTRHDPATNTWTHFANRAGGLIAAQPNSAGGYFLWTSGEASAGMDRWDSTTQAWTHIAYAVGNPVALLSKNSVDAAGNMWALRLADAQGRLTLDCLRPDGTWIAPPLPPLTTDLAAPFAALRPFGALQAYLVVIAPDNAYHLHRLDAAAWTDLGVVPHSGFIDAIDAAPDGTVWVCGTGQGGAIRRDPASGAWQRYRVTNTSQFDLFNNDLTISPESGRVYAAANAGAGVGGIVMFDGVRWTGFNEFTYGLGNAWPFPADNCESLYVRPSSERLVANPTNNFTHEFDGGSWTAVPGGFDQISHYLEDSVGRLWGAGHYQGLGIFQNGGFTQVPGGGLFSTLQRDPDRPGAIWCNSGGAEILRTDGAYRFSRSPADFPEIASVGAGFSGLAADHNGVVWVGTSGPSGTAGSALIRLNADTGAYRIWRHDLGWPFPGEHVRPRLVTPDGRIWMTYDSESPTDPAGLLAWDGTNVVSFPAPPGGEWRRGGLPHAGILDLEAKLLPDGYELWMSCATRGLAVLKVATACRADFDSSGALSVQDVFDFLNAWFSGSPAADFNGAGLSVQDIFDFLNAWFAGC